MSDAELAFWEERIREGQWLPRRISLRLLATLRQMIAPRCDECGTLLARIPDFPDQGFYCPGCYPDEEKKE